MRDENGCSVGRQPDLRLDRHRAQTGRLRACVCASVCVGHGDVGKRRDFPTARESAATLSISTVGRVPAELQARACVCERTGRAQRC